MIKKWNKDGVRKAISTKLRSTLWFKDRLPVQYPNLFADVNFHDLEAWAGCAPASVSAKFKEFTAGNGEFCVTGFLCTTDTRYCIEPVHGLAISPPFFAAKESLNWPLAYGFSYPWSYSFKTWGRTKRHVPGRLISLRSVQEAGSFYHQILDVIAKIVAAEHCGVLRHSKVLLHRELVKSRSFNQLVNALQCWLNHEIPFILHHDELISADELVFIHTPHFSQQLCTAFQELAGVTKKSRQQGRSKLFITRGLSADRRFENPTEVAELFRSKGFAVEDFATLTISQQIAKINAADLIVAEHGAALTMLIFAKDKKTIIEIFPPLYTPPHFYFIAKTMGHEYSCMVSSAIPGVNPFYRYSPPAIISSIE